jgi:signal transduction histidine kinase
MTMPAASGDFLARARTDAGDRLIEADEPLAGLQQRCGGELPGTVAIPELLALVRKSRTLGLRLGRTIQAFDGEETIRAWVEVAPDGEGGPEGCSIGLASWQAVPSSPEDEARAAERDLVIARQLAELTARLDPRQRLLTVECDAPDLRQAAAEMRQAIGRPWTDFIKTQAADHRQPLHWRLLDGTECQVAGSDRRWRVTLVPLGSPEPGSAGFELLLVPDAPLAQGPTAAAASSAEPTIPLLGQDLTPVLRQPIARIIANAETIRARLAGPLADEYSNYAADIATAGQHLLGLIDDLADLEIVESEGFATAADHIDLADVVRRAVGILGVRARERDITIELPDGGSQPAVGEFRRVLQILLNLIGNAISYGREGGIVRVELTREGDKALLTVADDGPGLTEAQRSVVFERFERLGRGDDGGSGLGLYISRQLARAMGGDLSVASAPGEGARFTLSLPALDERRKQPR